MFGLVGPQVMNEWMNEECQLGACGLLTVRLLASEVREIGDKLREVVARRRRELPVLLQPEGEPVEPRVAFLVHIVLDRLRVVPPRPGRIVDLCHLERRATFVDHVCDFLHRALVLVGIGIPA